MLCRIQCHSLLIISVLLKNKSIVILASLISVMPHLVFQSPEHFCSSQKQVMCGTCQPVYLVILDLAQSGKGRAVYTRVEMLELGAMLLLAALATSCESAKLEKALRTLFSS